MSDSKQTNKTKVMLAIAFAGGALLHDCAVRAQDIAEPADATILEVEKHQQLKPETRANRLLFLADLFIDNKPEDLTTCKTLLQYDMTQRGGRRPQSNGGSDWADRFSKFAGLYNGVSPKLQAIPSDKNAALAKEALDLAVEELEKTNDVTSHLGSYFLASGMYKKLGESAKAAKCDTVLSNAISACENSKTANEAQIKSVARFLNTMSCNIIYVEISDREPVPNPHAVIPTYSQKEFEASEKLRLRAIALYDRLDAKNQTRWMGHRDIVLWYRELGKSKLAEAEKLKLFALVGISDDRILYPRSGGCGSLVWWQVGPITRAYLCGMG